MYHLTKFMEETKRSARTESGYPAAGAAVLKKYGFRPEQQEGVTRNLRIDVHTIEYDRRTPLLKILMMALGQRGGNATAIARTENRQQLLPL